MVEFQCQWNAEFRLHWKTECRMPTAFQKPSILPFLGKCHWSHIADKDCGIWYNKEINVWEIGLGHNEIAPKKFDINDGYGYIRTVQDGPCPTVANTFEYRNIGWKPAPINSVIIKCAK